MNVFQTARGPTRFLNFLILSAVGLGSIGLSISSSTIIQSAFAEAEPAPKTIHGKVQISSHLDKKIGPKAALYIIARPDGVVGGPPTAVKRITRLKFPVEFELSAKDVMIPDVPFEGNFTLIARVSQNGSAMPSRGDLQTSHPPTGVKPGSSVTLNIDEVK